MSFPNLLYRISYSTIFSSSNIFFLYLYNMHKSVFTFGLLASSLVMLAIMPFLNQNNSFSNVMAQGYDNNGNDYGVSYSQYPTEDKKYECQTGPFEGFFVSSVEFCLAHSFDDHKKDRHREKPPPPVETETLTVIKNTECQADAQTCQQNPIQPSNFTVVIEGNNPSQNNFPGSSYRFTTWR